MRRIFRRVYRVSSFLVFVAAPLLAQPVDPALYGQLKWRMIGPFRGSRTVAVSGVPGRPNVFYMAPNNGGVWKSTDYGRTWRPIFDDQPTGSIGALAVAPSDANVIYVGSGEGLQRPDLSVGDGIYKSSDAGKTWRHMGLAQGRQIPSILVDPHDPNRVFVAVLGHPYGPNAERGVFRSTDGGARWERVLFKDEDTGAIDLAFDPSNSQRIYAVLWSARQAPWEYGNAYQGPGSGLFRSDDGGSTWKSLTRGLPTFAQGLGRIGIGVAPSDPKRLYALVQAASASGGLFRSDDAGESWERVNTEARIWSRGGDFADVRVHPRNRDIVYVANTSMYRSQDGGSSFTAIKGAPGGDDYHRIWINPENPDIILLGVDQGATVTVNGGESWSSWYNQPTAQMFHVNADNRFPYRLYGGQQESGSAGVWSRGNDGAITFREFHPVGGDEYGYCVPDPVHPGVVFGGKLTRYDEATGQSREVGPIALRTGAHRFDRTAPIAFSPVDPRVLYFASEVLWKTADGGENWEVVSPDLTRPEPGVPSHFGRLVSAGGKPPTPRGVIYAIAPSPKDARLIWVGTSDGLVHVTRDGGAHWENVTPTDLTAWSKVTQIDASRFDAATAYISVSRFRLDDLTPYIFRTHDGGKSWQRITKGLPDNASVNVVREDTQRKGLLFAGTERQVWASFDDGDHWQSLRQNMPATSIRDLIVHDDDIAIATHGRSFWILDDITPLRQIEDRVVGSPAHLFVPQVARRVRWNTNTDTPLPPEEPVGQNPPDGAIFDYWLKDPPSGPVVLEISDGAGKLVRRFASDDPPEAVNAKDFPIPTYWMRQAPVLSAQPGMHRFVWDMHVAPPDALNHEYPIAAIVHDTPLAPRGPWVPPGAYTVRLTVSGKSFTQPLSINMDPRVPAAAGDLQRQFEVAQRICGALERDGRAYREIGALRQSLSRLAGRAGSAAPAVASLDKTLRQLQSGASADDEAGPDTPAKESFARVNSALATLLEVVEGADARPTAQAVSALDSVEGTLTTLLAQWSAVESRDLPALNAALRQAGLPEAAIERSR